MAELILHFEAGAGTDVDAAAVALQAEIRNVAGVESADTAPRNFQSLTAAEVVTVVQIATQVVTSTTAFLGALVALKAAWDKVKASYPGLHPPKAEVGLKKIPIDQLTEAQLAQIAKQ